MGFLREQQEKERQRQLSQKIAARRIRYVIPEHEMARAAELARRRNLKEEHFGAMTYAGSSKHHGGYSAHLLGIVPELAVSLVFGVQVDERIYRYRGDDGLDLVLPHLGKTGVKGTTYTERPWMRVEVEHFREDLDAYLCVSVNQDSPAEVWLVGWATPERVKQVPPRPCAVGLHENYILREDELNPVDPAWLKKEANVVKC